MAYARWGHDSDVYVYNTGLGIICQFCDGFDTRNEMIEHLKKHRESGDKVPNEAFELLFEELKKYGDKVKTDLIHEEENK
jgi:hypothetical protein